MTLSASKRKWRLPECLNEYAVDEDVFRKWLRRRALAHVKRDKQRGFLSASVPNYMQTILTAIEKSQGRDYYTGEKLDWSLIGLWRGTDDAEPRGQYRRKFWKLPSVDHDFTDPQNPIFHICSWRMNDSKNDQSIAEFLALAAVVREHLPKVRR
jgi:hypothetical protein